MDTILEILLGESYNGIRVLTDLSMCVKIYQHLPKKRKKEEMNKIAHVLLQKYFQVSKERYDFKEHSRIRLATIHIHHTTTHMHILI